MSEMLPQVSRKNEFVATWCQKGADWLTRFRGEKAKYVGTSIALTRRGWLSTAAAAALMATDYIDGKLARHAQKLMGTDQPLTDGAREDPRTDKLLMRWLWGGVMVRAAREGDAKTFAVMGMVSYATFERNKRMEAHRNTVEEHDLDIGVAAIKPNKDKTLYQSIGTLGLISPLSNFDVFRDLSLGIIVRGTQLGEVGEQEYGGMVADSLALTLPESMDPSLQDLML